MARVSEEKAIIHAVATGLPSIGEFSKVAPYLTNPLVLIGFVLLLVFGIHRALIKSGILPPVSKTESAKIVRLLLHYGFIVALLLIFLGFGLVAWNSHAQKTGNAITSGPQSPAVTGDGNQVNYDQPSQPEQKPKPSK
jgi:hypothetical protein